MPLALESKGEGALVLWSMVASERQPVAPFAGYLRWIISLTDGFAGRGDAIAAAVASVPSSIQAALWTLTQCWTFTVGQRVALPKFGH